MLFLIQLARNFNSDSSVRRRECFCNMQFNIKACSVQGIFKTADVMKNDPDSVACKPGSIDVMSVSSLSTRFLT
jgi:hypothetical protein